MKKICAVDRHRETSLLPQYFEEAMTTHDILEEKTTNEAVVSDWKFVSK